MSFKMVHSSTFDNIACSSQSSGTCIMSSALIYVNVYSLPQIRLSKPGVY